MSLQTSRYRRLGVVAAATAATLTAAVLPALSDQAVGASAVSGAGRAAVASPFLTQAVPSWAKGTPALVEPGSAPFSFAIQLRTRHAAELKALAASVSDPASADYQRYLTKAQYAARYAPTVASQKAVLSWVSASGMHLSYASSQRTFMEVHTTAAVAAAAFHTSFAQFRVGGLLLRAPLSTPVVPTALRGIVYNVAGLAQSKPLQHLATPAPVFLNARPCSQYYGQETATKQPKYEGKKLPYAVCGYSGDQLRTAYGLKATGLTGKGASVGIVDAYASPTIHQDANTYAVKHGSRVFQHNKLVQRVPAAEEQIPEDPMSLLLDPQGWAGEQTLDVEAVHGMAPDARVIYQSATSPYGPGLYMALSTIVESGDVQIVSNSYGTGSDSPLPTDQQMVDQITQEAAATGVTVMFSAGDDGDETDPSADGSRTADFPATSPGVVAVGGTSLQINKKGQRTFETYWGTRKDPLKAGAYDFKNKVYSGAGGGGVSTTYAEPAWQKAVVPSKLTTIGGISPGRVEPDVSMDADSTTGFLTGQTQKFADGSIKYSEYRIGGTSESCPLFAGTLALVVGKRGGKGLGLVTPSLYGASKTAAGRKKLFTDPSGVKINTGTKQSQLANVRPDFTDTTDPKSAVTYSLRTLGNLATLHHFVGYDDSTGLGVPRIAALLGLLVKKR